MGARLARAVYVTDPRTHEPLILQPGDEPVPWVAELITNPYAWEGGEVPSGTPAVTAPPVPDGTGSGEDQGGRDPDGSGSDPETAVPDPEPDLVVPEPDPEPSPELAVEAAGEEAEAEPQAAEPVKRPSGRRPRKGDAAAE